MKSRKDTNKLKSVLKKYNIQRSITSFDMASNSKPCIELQLVDLRSKSKILKAEPNIHNILVLIDSEGEVGDVCFIFKDDERKDEVGYLGMSIEEFVPHTKQWNRLNKVWRIVRKEIE